MGAKQNIYSQLGLPFRLLPKVNMTGLWGKLSKCWSSTERLSDCCSVVRSWSFGGVGEGEGGARKSQVPGGSPDRRQVVTGQELQTRDTE